MAVRLSNTKSTRWTSRAICKATPLPKPQGEIDKIILAHLRLFGINADEYRLLSHIAEHADIVGVPVVDHACTWLRVSMPRDLLEVLALFGADAEAEDNGDIEENNDKFEPDPEFDKWFDWVPDWRPNSLLLSEAIGAAVGGVISMTTTTSAATPAQAEDKRALTDIINDLDLHLWQIKEAATIIGEAIVDTTIDQDLYNRLAFGSRAITDYAVNAEACLVEAHALCVRVTAALRVGVGAL